jgi:gamma-glutamyltranspeptidase/glutathione hydrolase
MKSYLIALIALWPISAAHGQSAGVVSSASPEATAAGVEILEAGGNAIDAAVAVGFALGVTEPAMSGIGGQSQIIVHPPQGEPFVINGTSFAPGNLPADRTQDDLQTGWTGTTVPSTVKVLGFAQARFGSGTVSWADALEPSIRYAEDGFVIGPFRDLVYKRHLDDLKASETAAPLFLLEGGVAPQEGDILRQPVLAQTLRRLAAEGPDEFYSGRMAQTIAEDMARYGGWITAEDLAATPDPEVVPALHTTYRGYDVYTLPPPAGGWVVLLALNILEHIAVDDSLSREDERRATTLIRALHAAHRARKDDPETVVGYEDDIARRTGKPYAVEWSERGGETTHYSVVDGDGMAVSVTASIDSYFGARVASPSLGFLYNNYMQSYREADDHPFALRPRARPYSSMSATIVARDGVPVLVLGSPGSSRIISAVTQVTSHWIDIGSGIVSAVAAHRVHVGIDDDGRDNAYVEADMPGLDLGALGLDRSEPRTDLIIDGRNAYYGGVHAIAREESGWVGAADPRRDGTVGYAERGDR